MTLRTLRPEDAAAASALDPVWSTDAFLAAHRQTLVAETEGAISGYVLLSVVPPEAEILNIVVAPQQRGRGLATALLRAACGHLRQAGVTTVRLEVRESNHPARRLYQRFGFRLAGRRTQYYQHPAEDALLLETTLTLC